MVYDYLDPSLLVKDDFSRYDETREEIIEGLEEQVPSEDISAEELMEDSRLEILGEVFSGETTVEPLRRYSIDELGEMRVVYTFDHSLGFEVVGDYAMIREAAPEYVPDAAIPMPGAGMD